MGADAEQAVELLSRLIAAGTHGRDDQDGRRAEVVVSAAISARGCRSPALSCCQCCTSDWQAQRRESGRSVAVPGGRPRPTVLVILVLRGLRDCHGEAAARASWSGGGGVAERT